MLRATLHLYLLERPAGAKVHRPASGFETRVAVRSQEEKAVRQFTDEYNVLPWLLSERERLIRYVLEMGEKPPAGMLAEIGRLHQCISAFEAVCPKLLAEVRAAASGPSKPR